VIVGVVDREVEPDIAIETEDDSVIEGVAVCVITRVAEGESVPDGVTVGDCTFDGYIEDVSEGVVDSVGTEDLEAVGVNIAVAVIDCDNAGVTDVVDDFVKEGDIVATEVNDREEEAVPV